MSVGSSFTCTRGVQTRDKRHVTRDTDTRHVTRDTRPAQPHLAVGVLAVAALAGGAAAAVSRPGGAGHKG